MKLYELYFLEQKWMKLLRQGKLSKKSIARIKKSSIVKPVDTWLSGIDRGSDTKLLNMGAKVSNVPNQSYIRLMQKVGDKIKKQIINKVYQIHGVKLKPEQIKIEIPKVGKQFKSKIKIKINGIEQPYQIWTAHGVFPSTTRANVHMPSNYTKKEIGDMIQTKAHEVDEIDVTKQMLKKYRRARMLATKAGMGGKKSLSYAKRRENILKQKPKDQPGKVVQLRGGQHMSDEVLRRERERGLVANSLYGKKGGMVELTKVRKQTGEYKNLPFSKKEIAKYDNAEIKAMPQKSKELQQRVLKLPLKERQRRYKLSKDELLKSGASHRVKRVALRRYRQWYGL